MKRYFISSPKFTGELELIFAEELLSVDFTKTDIPPPQKLWFMRNIPTLETLFFQFAKDYPTLQIITEDADIDFETWWKEYDDKINKPRTLALWNKLNRTERVAAWLGLLRYNRHLKKNQWKNKMNPETFLSKKSYHNEYK